jgi:hypothetical protein
VTPMSRDLFRALTVTRICFWQYNRFLGTRELSDFRGRTASGKIGESQVSSTCRSRVDFELYPTGSTNMHFFAHSEDEPLPLNQERIADEWLTQV